MTGVLQGMSTGLLVTIITLLSGLILTALGWGGIEMSTLVDIGLVISCLAGGYRTGRISGQWILGGVAGVGYVGVGVLLLALFLPVQGMGVIQIMLEGGVLGLVAGAIGAGSLKAIPRINTGYRIGPKNFRRELGGGRRQYGESWYTPDRSVANLDYEASGWQDDFIREDERADTVFYEAKDDDDYKGAEREKDSSSLKGFNGLQGPAPSKPLDELKRWSEIYEPIKEKGAGGPQTNKPLNDSVELRGIFDQDKPGDRGDIKRSQAWGKEKQPHWWEEEFAKQIKR